VKRLRSILRRHAKSGEVVAFVELTGVMWPEGDVWVSQCVELEIASFGPNPDEAQTELMDAVCAYLNTLEELGERERVLEQRGIQVYANPPRTGTYSPSIPREYLRREGAQIRPMELPLPPCPAYA
jgi:hypothetical protein